MTPTLDRFLSQWQRYKTAMVVFLSLNVFSVTCAFVLGINFFSVKKDLGERHSASLQNIMKADKALVALDQLLHDIQSRTKLEIRSAEDERRVLALLARWQEARDLANQVLPQAIQLQTAVLIFNSENQSLIGQMRASLLSVKESEWQNLNTSLHKYNDRMKLLITTGAITLIFGIILPLTILYLMGRAVNRLRIELQNTALEFIKTWAETKAGFGEEAFKNVEFWLQVLLLIGQNTSRVSTHPLAVIAGELAYLVRLELQRKNNAQAA